MKYQFLTKLTSAALAVSILVVPASSFAKTDLSTPREVSERDAAAPQTNGNIGLSKAELASSLSKAVNAAEFGLGENTQTAAVASLESAAAVITIFADGTSGGAGSSGSNGSSFGTHTFITVKNVSSQNIQVGKFSGIAPGKSMSLGTWGNKTEHKGLWYNIEAYFIYKNGFYANRVSTFYILTASQLATLNSYIINNDYWSLSWNCSSFAVGAWNSAVASSYRLSAGFPNTPASLANNIRATGGYQTGAAVPWNYIVYYAQGTGSPKASTVYK